MARSIGRRFVQYGVHDLKSQSAVTFKPRFSEPLIRSCLMWKIPINCGKTSYPGAFYPMVSRFNIQNNSVFTPAICFRIKYFSNIVIIAIRSNNTAVARTLL